MKNLRQLLLILAATLSIGGLQTTSAHAAEPAAVAMTTDVQGTAWLIDGGKQSKLGLMSYLPNGAKLRLDKNARIAITYFTVSREFTLSGPVEAVVETDTLRSQNGAAPISRNLDQNQVAAGKKFTTQQRERQALATFEMKAFGNLQLLQPVNTKLLGAPTELSWQAIPNVKTYRLTLSNAQGKTLHTAQTDTASLRLPENLKLKAGKTYTWAIEATSTDGQKQSASAEFSLLDEATTRNLSTRKPASNASFSERLLYATMLENAGASLAASTYWKALANERPEDETLQQLSNR